MGDVMCIVSKAIFEKVAGKKPALGTVLGMERYVTANKALSPLADGGKLYLVTVRPPDESLWLVAVLEEPTRGGDGWEATANAVGIVDISNLRSKLVFANGKGLPTKAGTLGMSLQTPRELTEDDAALIDAMLPGAEKHEGDGFPEAPEGIPASTGERVIGDALVKAVIEEPYNDLARQVYADALQARNDPRGEFVMLELALAGPLAIRKRDQMKARRDELFAQHEDEWFSTGVAFRTRGGFITAITGPFSVVDSEATALFSTQPIVEVQLTKVAIGKLARAPWLRYVHHLILRGAIGGDKGFAELVASPFAQQLTELNVTGTSLGGGALKGLKSYLPALRTLVLTKNLIGAAGITELVKWPHLANMETLYLSGCGLATADVAKLLAQPLPALTKLTLADNKLDSSIGKVLGVAAKHVPKLEQLELAGNKQIDATSVKALTDAKLPAIRRIDLRLTKVRPDDIAELPLFRAGRA